MNNRFLGDRSLETYFFPIDKNIINYSEYYGASLYKAMKDDFWVILYILNWLISLKYLFLNLSNNIFVESEVLTATRMKTAVVWNVTHHPDDGDSTIFWNVYHYLPE
jgi:hypothetical protein